MIFIFILWILCRLRSQRKSEFWFTPRLLLISPVLFLFLLALLQASRIAAVVYDFLNSFELSNSGVSGNTQDDGLGGVEKGSHLLWNISMLSPELKLTVISSTPSSCRKRTSCPPGSCWRCSPPPRGRCSRAPGSPGWWAGHRRGPPPHIAPHFSPSTVDLKQLARYPEDTLGYLVFSMSVISGNAIVKHVFDTGVTPSFWYKDGQVKLWKKYSYFQSDFGYSLTKALRVLFGRHYWDLETTEALNWILFFSQNVGTIGILRVIMWLVTCI